MVTQRRMPLPHRVRSTARAKAAQGWTLRPRAGCRVLPRVHSVSRDHAPRAARDDRPVPGQARGPGWRPAHARTRPGAITAQPDRATCSVPLRFRDCPSRSSQRSSGSCARSSRPGSATTASRASATARRRRLAELRRQPEKGDQAHPGPRTGHLHRHLMLVPAGRFPGVASPVPGLRPFPGARPPGRVRWGSIPVPLSAHLSGKELLREISNRAVRM